MAKDYPKLFEEVVASFLGEPVNDMDYSSYFHQPFKPYALLFAICVYEVDCRGEVYRPKDLEKLIHFTAELPEQNPKVMRQCVDFFINKINRDSRL